MSKGLFFPRFSLHNARDLWQFGAQSRCGETQCDFVSKFVESARGWVCRVSQSVGSVFQCPFECRRNCSSGTLGKA